MDVLKLSPICPIISILYTIAADSNPLPWRFTGTDGVPNTSCRTQTWNLLRLLHSHMYITWLCAGDFIELRNSEEKLGGASRSSVLMNNFNYAILDSGFHEVPFTGPLFTWHRGEGSAMVLERFDRGMANEEWLSHFPHAIKHHLMSKILDRSSPTFIYL